MAERSGPGIMQYAGLGMLNAACILLGLLGGWWADSTLGTLPVFLMVGLLVGGALGVALTRHELHRRF